MTSTYQALRDEFTADEIRDFCLERFNLRGVLPARWGISFNRHSADKNSYGWLPMSEEALADLLAAMRDG